MTVEIPTSREMPDLYTVGGTKGGIEKAVQKPFEEKKERTIAFILSIFLHAFLLFLFFFSLNPIQIQAPPDYLVPVQLDASNTLTEGNAPQSGAPETTLTQPIPQNSSEVSTTQTLPEPQSKGETSQAAPQPNPSNTPPSNGGLPGDREIPTPIRSVAPIYPKDALNNNWQGTVVLEVAIDSTGAPLQIRVVKSSGHSSLDNAFIRTVQRYYTFKPKRFLGRDIPGTVQISYTFSLESDS
jgi:protein TonB